MTTTANIEKLISRIATGDRRALAALYDATSDKLFGVCLRVLGDGNEAEQALQETYIKIWLKAETYFTSRLSPMTWLVTLARNKAIDRVRLRRAAFSGIDAAFDLADSSSLHEEVVMAMPDSAHIEACLAELEGTLSNAVRSAYLDGDSYPDLAKRFNVPVKTMRTWMHRSLVKLRECLNR